MRPTRPLCPHPLYLRPLSLAFAAALIAGTLGACSTTPAGPEQPPADVTKAKPEIQRPDIATVTPPQVDTGRLPPELSDPKNILSKRSVYFDYDKYEIRDEYKDLVAAHANFLSKRRDFKALIQGNADERGSREYNLALGQKRADAVKKSLILLGATEDQIESVSLGEEKPKAVGHDEAAWAENRRGDVLYRGEY